MLNLILFGPPGSGKGTQAANIMEKYNLLHISTGDLFRYEMGNQFTDVTRLAEALVFINFNSKCVNYITNKCKAYISHKFV